MIVCPKCGLEARKSNTKYGIRYDCCGLWAWGEFPLANKRTHKARRNAHAAFDTIWKSGLLTRKKAYEELANLLGLKKDQCHMKLMDYKTAEMVPLMADLIKIKIERGEL